MTTVQYSLATVNDKIIELNSMFIRARNKANSCVQGSKEFWAAVCVVRDIEKEIIRFHEDMSTLGIKAKKASW